MEKSLFLKLIKFRRRKLSKWFGFFDQNQNSIYGPYTDSNSSAIFPSVLNSKEIVMIYFEPYNSSFNGSFSSI